MLEPKLTRWAERKGRAVKWGNMVAGYCGQSFTEEFRTEEEAIERERQALACEAIGEGREPIAIKRSKGA